MMTSVAGGMKTFEDLQKRIVLFWLETEKMTFAYKLPTALH
jgi:hypothetical protein